MNNCVYCNTQENGNAGDEWGWFSANQDGYNVCPDCEEKYGLDETIADEMYHSPVQERKRVMSDMGKRSWESRKGQDMSALARKRWAKKSQ
jgi:uncharacterized Zn finger protein (UPF0148 family)